MTQWEIGERKDLPGAWNVEQIQDDGAVAVTIFAGHAAKERAQEYCDWKNGIRKPGTILELVKR